MEWSIVKSKHIKYQLTSPPPPYHSPLHGPSISPPSWLSYLHSTFPKRPLFTENNSETFCHICARQFPCVILLPKLNMRTRMMTYRRNKNKSIQETLQLSNLFTKKHDLLGYTIIFVVFLALVLFWAVFRMKNWGHILRGKVHDLWSITSARTTFYSDFHLVCNRPKMKKTRSLTGHTIYLYSFNEPVMVNILTVDM